MFSKQYLFTNMVFATTYYLNRLYSNITYYFISNVKYNLNLEIYILYLQFTQTLIKISMLLID